MAFVLFLLSIAFFRRDVSQNHLSLCERREINIGQIVSILVTMIFHLYLFSVTIKHVIYKSSQCVCAPVPPGKFHSFEQNNMDKRGLCYGAVKQNPSPSMYMGGLFKNISI